MEARRSAGHGWSLATSADRAGRPGRGDVVLPRPQRKPGAGSVHRQYWQADGAYPLPCRADVDNLAKAALDALQDARVILDDRLAVRLLATKQAGDRPGVTVTVSVVEPGESIL